ncbi:MAG: hypothetical protein V4496_05815 [Pseudomonadota bacterium]
MLKFPGPESTPFSIVLSKQIADQQRESDQNSQDFRFSLKNFKDELKLTNPTLVSNSSNTSLIDMFLNRLEEDLLVKRNLLEETQTLKYENYLFGTHAFNEDTSLLSCLYMTACLQDPTLKAKKDFSYDELLDAIFNTLDIACYIYVKCTFPARGLSLTIIGSEQELQKIVDIATNIQAQTTDPKYLIHYFDVEKQEDVNLGMFSPEWLAIDKSVSRAYHSAFENIPVHEIRSHFNRPPKIVKLLQTSSQSNYSQAMQSGISQFTANSENNDKQSNLSKRDSCLLS